MPPLLHAARIAAACVVLCATSATLAQPISWIFYPSTYTHDPYTGARVAQYAAKPPVEPLPDQRLVTSRYRRTNTTLRGTDGSLDTSYQVQSWGNGRGGLDAEWERFHDAWLESIYQGSYYSAPAYGYPPYGQYAPYGAGATVPPFAAGYGPGSGYGGPAWGGPVPGGQSYGGPGPGHGHPAAGHGRRGGPGHGDGGPGGGPGYGGGRRGGGGGGGRGGP